MRLSYLKIRGIDVSELVDRIENAVDGEPNSHVSIACLAVAIVAQKPDIPVEELVELIRGTSEYLAAHLFVEGVN